MLRTIAFLVHIFTINREFFLVLSSQNGVLKISLKNTAPEGDNITFVYEGFSVNLGVGILLATTKFLTSNHF